MDMECTQRDLLWPSGPLSVSQTSPNQRRSTLCARAGSGDDANVLYLHNDMVYMISEPLVHYQKHKKLSLGAAAAVDTAAGILEDESTFIWNCCCKMHSYPCLHHCKSELGFAI